MRKRQLGRSGLYVAPLALGGNVFGWTVNERASFELLDTFTAAGFNLIDTADIYSRWAPGNVGGESETIIGRWLKRSGKRAQVLIATKVGKEMGPEQKGLARAYILRAVEASLQRLQTDYIDLYQSHEDDAGTPLDETIEAFAQLIAAGKVRAIGASNHSAPRLALALQASARGGLPGYQSLQPLYNLYDRGLFETELGPLCRANELGVIPYYSLAAGFLTGKYRTQEDLAGKARAAMVKKYLTARGFRILSTLERVAEQHGVKPAAVALAWLIGRPGVTAAIASATGPAQLDELIAATRLELDRVAVVALDRASSPE